MKKKLIVATAIVLLIAISTSMLVGCDEIFKKNETRDAKQIVATVTYDGALGTQTENIYKFELATTFNSSAYIYVNYYGMTYEATANYLAQSLASQRLLAMYAKDYLAQKQGLTALPSSFEDLLNANEKNKAIEDSNDSMLDALISTVEDLITEDNANNAASSDDTTDSNVEIDESKTYSVRFESNGGSDVEKQKVNHNAKATEPDDPTRTGYTFYGWYQNEELEGDEFDFNTPITENIRLYARWEKHIDPRTELPKAEEEDEFDADADFTGELAKKFYDASYKAQLLDDTSEDSLFTTKFLNSDFADKVDSENKVQALKDYINEGLAELEDTLKGNLYLDSFEECYEYYLNAQQRSLLIDRFELEVSRETEASQAEIEAEFNAAVAKNKETFAGSDTSYSSALTSSLSSTYYHPTDERGYGFVINILFKLDDESMDTLKTMATNHPTNVKAILTERDRLISQMTAHVSNPEYDSTAIVEDSNGNEIELRDAMTDAKNPYNNAGKSEYDHSYQKDGGNNYNQIVSFEKVDGEYQIVFNATEHPAMAYLLEEVPVFDSGEQIGLIHQIHNSLNAVKQAVSDGELTKAQGVYWLREVATTWAYLVSDDSGATSSDSNNGGLGYLITPEGEDSQYLADFTDYARKLIKNGTGSFSIGDVADSDFAGIAGNNKTFVIADNLVVDGVASTSNSSAYAGVFVLLNSLTVWDDTLYDGTLPTDGILPLDYIITYGKDESKTIRETISESITEAKKSDVYNNFVNQNISTDNDKNNIEYFEKVIKQLWEDLD